jgi:hypothetical protein
LTNLPTAELWSKGDLMENQKSTYTFSRITIMPNPEPDDFDGKLKKLLDSLEQDAEGIKVLVEKADGYNGVAQTFYINGNKGIHLDNETIVRLGNLGLSIDFDQYVNGNDFLD